MNVSILETQSAQWVTPSGKSSDTKSSTTSDPDQKSRITDPIQERKEEKREESAQRSNDPIVTSRDQLSAEQLEMLDKLKARDREVRMHEAAHLAAAGRYATSGASYTYQKGPDGQSYAIGGEVNIDVSPVPNDPEATVEKADTIIQAALAAADPSDQDLKVAQAARQMRVQAMAERTAKEQTEAQQAQQERDIRQEQQSAQQAEQQDDPATSQTTGDAMLVIGDTISWLERVARNRYESVFGVSISSKTRNTIGFNVFA